MNSSTVTLPTGLAVLRKQSSQRLAYRASVASSASREASTDGSSVRAEAFS